MHDRDEEGEEPGLELASLRDAFEGCLARGLELARRAGEDQAGWATWFRGWTSREPTALTSSGLAAHPSELREALLAIQRGYRAELAALAPPADPDDPLWDFYHHRLDDFVSQELARYTKAVARKPGLGSVFAAAAQRQQQARGGAAAREERQYTLRCQACGAPRQQDNLYDACAYCGTPFFPGEDPGSDRS